MTGDDGWQKVYAELIKITAAISKLEGRLDGFVTHEKNALDTVARDRRISDTLTKRVDGVHDRMNRMDENFSDRARTVIKSELPDQIDRNNERDTKAAKRAQILGLTGASAGVGGILLWIAQSIGG